jgi:hypothetical protein
MKQFGYVLVTACVLALYLAWQFLVNKEVIPNLSSDIPVSVDTVGENREVSVELPFLSAEEDMGEPGRTASEGELVPLWPLQVAIEEVILERRPNNIHSWALEVDKSSLDSLMENDRMAFYIPQTEEVLSATVESVKQNRFSQTKTARLDNVDGSYIVQFTYSDKSIHGLIETPRAKYRVETINAGKVVIYDLAQLYANIDYSISDVDRVEPRPGSK